MKKTVGGKIDISNIKRCYLEGATIKIKCPNCENELTKDLEDDYLSYPEIGKEGTLGFYCENCENKKASTYEFFIPIKIISAIVTIEFDPDNPSKETP